MPPGDIAGKPALALLTFDMAVQERKQMVYFIKKPGVVEGKGNEEHRERDVLTPELAEYVAHCPCHYGKTRRLLGNKRRGVGRKGRVIAAEAEIFTPIPFDDDAVWFWRTHKQTVLALYNQFGERGTAGRVTGLKKTRLKAPCPCSMGAGWWYAASEAAQGSPANLR
jgi:hypothetical protein